MEKYNFEVEPPDGYLYFVVRRGMYSLKDAIAFKQPVTKLVAPSCGYYSPMKYTPGLLKHNTCKTNFALCIDNFGVKYFPEADDLHLVNAVKDSYEVTISWEGKIYWCGAACCCPVSLLAADELRHPQPPNGTPFYTDNSTAAGIL